MAKYFDKDVEKRGCFGIDFVMRVAVALDWLAEEPKGCRDSFEGLWNIGTCGMFMYQQNPNPCFHFHSTSPYFPS